LFAVEPGSALLGRLTIGALMPSLTLGPLDWGLLAGRVANALEDIAGLFLRPG
jgi:hypothetical protein